MEKRIVYLPTQEGYDRWAEQYDQFANPLVALDLLYAPKLLGRLEGLRVCDLGCGTGRYLPLFRDKKAEITACDFSPGMLAKAKDRMGDYPVEFIEMDLNKSFDLEDLSYDLLFSSLVLEHISNLRYFFQETFRITKKGGRFITSTMHPAMFLRQTQAHFSDGETEFRFESFPHQVSDFLNTARAVGWEYDTLKEVVVSDDLIEKTPKWAKWKGWPVLLVMGFKRY